MPRLSPASPVIIGTAIALTLIAVGLHAVYPHLSLVLELIVTVSLLVLAAQYTRSVEKTISECRSRLALPQTDTNAHTGAESIEQTCSQLEELLRERTREVRAVVDNAADIICVLDTSGKFLSVNQSAKRVWGYSAEDLIGKPLAEYLVGDDRERSIEAILGAEKSIASVSLENRFRRKDGTIVDLLWSTHWSATDEVLFCVVHDITERKEAEMLLRQSEARIKVILENLPVATMIVDDTYRLEYSNELCRKVFSMTAGAHLSTHIESGTCAELVSTAMRESVETTLITDSGSKRQQAEVSSAILNYHTGVKKYLLTAVDLTARNELDRLKRQFIAMVTHDLRTPLTTLEGIFSMFDDGVAGELNDRGTKLAKQGSIQAGRMVDLVNDLLDLDKIESGQFTIERQPISILELSKSAVDAVNLIATEQQVGVVIDDCDFRCTADAGRLTQVLINLLSNAIKFSPKGESVTISASEENGAVRIVVRDNGRGIPADQVERVFNKFAQVTTADGRRGHGTGLGLAICKAIVECHGGTIGVTCPASGGSEFWFTIPDV